MTTPSGHTSAIAASRVIGTNVYNTNGESIGEVKEVFLDKTSDKILFAAISFGGFLGIGEKYHAVPWGILDYDENYSGYAIALTKEQLEQAPTYDLNDFTKNVGSSGAGPTLDYYTSLRPLS